MVALANNTAQPPANCISQGNIQDFEKGVVIELLLGGGGGVIPPCYPLPLQENRE